MNSQKNNKIFERLPRICLPKKVQSRVEPKKHCTSIGSSRGKQIVIGVLAAHVVCLLVLLTDYFCKMRPVKRHKIAVNMVQIEVSQKQAPRVKAAPKTANQKAPVKTVPKAPLSPKKEVKDKTPPLQKKVDTALLNEIAENLESLTCLMPASLPKTVIQIPTLSESAPREYSHTTTDDRVAAFLQEALTLPEFGEVRASLSIDTVGRLQSLEILSSKSEKNARFLKNRLPELQYPCLNEGATLTIVFSNAL